MKLGWMLPLFLAVTAQAQQADSLLAKLDSSNAYNTVEATFKSTRVVLSHSSETQKKHDLDLRIRHHFGDIGGQFGGSHTLFGLDVASDLFIGLDYGITDRLTIGIGRSRQNETYNAFLKYKVLQQKNDGSMPVTVTALVQTGWIMREPRSSSEFSPYSNRLSYLVEPIIARKFSSHLSVELLPAWLHRNITTDPDDPENLFSIGIAGRLKLTRRISFVADYTWVNGLSRPPIVSQTYYNPLGVGIEIETGGHVFSLDFMNSESILENNFIPNTKKSWTNGGVRFGFTISRNFTLFKSKNADTRSKIY
ncbi:hypothetical protein FW774_16315 [Pedobacter sp. BS3]|uniref:DUF5777 family beta-barrel protein n=1 Tax=Pedobacter sp. BS3 TaxID=2567937 RepID=UPI0011EBE414|nr:DUF5777 family beta-barrel protein [Pedobacter sp. BS3]TZF82249.1 hypothetical protein FW774_16315 [Pedobacter sp. BS3]